MKKCGILLIAILSFLITSFLFLNFTNTLTFLDLNFHPSHHVFLYDDIDFVAPVPAKLKACQMEYKPELGDLQISLPENIEKNADGSIKYKGYAYGNLNSSTRRVVQLTPAKCLLQGSLEIIGDNIELDCNNAVIDGSMLPANYEYQGSPRKTSRSGILVGKRFAQRKDLVSGATINDPIVVSANLAQLLQESGFDGVSATNKVDPYALVKFADGLSANNQNLKMQIKDVITTKNIIVRNCNVRNFPSDGIHVGWRMPDDTKVQLVPDLEERKTWGTHDVSIINNLVKRMLNVGIYIDDHTYNSTIQSNTIVGNEGTGIYLEYHSYKNLVQENKIFKNGFHINVDNKTAARVREGIAIDGSVNNQIINNAFWDNGIGGIYLYKNCGEGLAAPGTTGSASRLLGANNNTIQRNRFYRERIGVWVASRQEASMQRMKCSDATPYPEMAMITNDQGKQEGPYHMHFLDHATNNLIDSNLFVDDATGIKVSDDNNILSTNTFKGQMGMLVDVGNSRRFSVLGRPVIGTQIVGNISKVTPADNFALYHYYIHPQETLFQDNIQIVRNVLKKTCGPMIKSVKAKNNPKMTCAFYLLKGTLAEGEVSLFSDMTPANVKGGTSGTGEYKCLNGEWKEMVNNCVYLDK